MKMSPGQVELTCKLIKVDYIIKSGLPHHQPLQGGAVPGCKFAKKVRQVLNNSIICENVQDSQLIIIGQGKLTIITFPLLEVEM